MFFWMGLFAALAVPTTGPDLSVQGITIEGRTIEGRWQGLDPQGRIVLQADNATHELSPSEISILNWPARASTSQPADEEHPWTIHLPDQSRFAARLSRSEKGRLTFQTRYAYELTLALGDIAAIRFASEDQNDLRDAFRALMEKRDSSEDTLLVVRDDRLSSLKGVTDALTADRLTFKWRARSREFTTDSIYGLMMAGGVQSREQAPVLCFLKGGDIWAGSLLAGGREELVLELASGGQITLPVDKLNEIRFRSDRVLFLSELEPKDYACEPFATTPWKWRRDRSVANRPLRIGRRDYARGIGMHSQSKLVFEVPPGYRHFAADIGIDEGVGYLGHAVMRVLIDGREIYNSGPVTGRDEPKSILVPIQNAKELTLAVDYGQELDIGDQADWGNARLVK